jgi:streptogrisin C
MRAPGASTATSWTSRRPLLVASIGLLLAGLLASQAPPAAAGGKPMPAGWPPYRAAATDPAVTTLARDLGISIREAQQRMGWQEPAIELAGELERALGDRYGDLWFDPHTGRVKVGIVGGRDTAALAARLIARRKLTSVTDLVAVRHSYAELSQAAAWLTAETAKANPRARNGLVKGLTVRRLPDKNAVELDLPRGQRLTTAQQATVSAARRRLGGRLTLGTWSGQMRDLACYWAFGEFHCDPPLRGGVMMYIRSGTSYIAQCTVGFNAKSTVDGKWYVMTAGHCGSPGTTFYVYQPRDRQFHVLGHMHNCVWGGDPNCVWSSNDDEGIITIDNVPGWEPKPWVFVHAWVGLNGDRTTENPSYPIYGTGGSSQHMRVCVSGGVSGTSCGNVESFTGVGGLAQVDLCGEPGDSGAPIFSGQKAYGLLKGVNLSETGKRPPACQDRLYQGITEATQRLHVAVVLALR